MIQSNSKQIGYIKIRNGNDLENPVYIGNLTQNQRTQESIHGENLYYSVSRGKKKAEDLTDLEKKHMYNYMIDTGKATVYDFNEYTVQKYGLDRPGQEAEQLYQYGQSIYSKVSRGTMDKNDLTDIQRKAMYNYMIDTGKATIYDFNDQAIKKYGLERDNQK